MLPEPCDNFRPGRATAHDECEFCGWTRHQHPRKEFRLPFKGVPGGDFDELKSALADRDRYHAMLLEIGAMFGKAARTAENGDLQQGVIVTKVPGLVKALLEVKGYRTDADKLPATASVRQSDVADFIEQWEDFVYDSRKVDGYSKGTYAMINGPASAKALANEVRELFGKPLAANSQPPTPASSVLPESVREEARAFTELGPTHVEQVYDKPKPIKRRAAKEKDIA